ncbi:MAG TPA: lipopolysaccharide transport periplasmic protein LptA [Burkholderiales bacterium]|nr:lipopolysaccharide transport periplasmic protein LptA [Burkholderiales bacterium]
MAERFSRIAQSFMLAATLALFFSAAHAEKADREKPIHLEADRVTVDEAKQIAMFEGNVVLTQGTMTIRGDRMQVRQDEEGFRYGTTWGDLAYFRQKREGYDEYIEGWAERIEYDGRADKVQMFTRASMKRGQDEVHGNYISYDAVSEFFQVIGGGTKAASAANPQGRVRAILQPKPKEKPAAAPPVPLKPTDKLGTRREETGSGAAR